MARGFLSSRGLESAGVLCVLQAFQTDELAENIRHLPQRISSEFSQQGSSEEISKSGGREIFRRGEVWGTQEYFVYFKFPEPMDRRKSSGIRRRGFLQSFPPKKKGALRLLKPNELETLRQMARGLAAQFGSNCEVVVHEISERSTSHSVVAIENGHVSGRKLGDGPSQVVLEQLGKDGRAPEDQLCYLTRTPDGKLLKSSSIYIRDESGRVCAIFCINFDISALAMAEQALAGLTSAHPAGEETPRITHNVNDLLDDLIEQSDRLIGKPVALMSKEDKVRAIHFLNEHGALLVTKSGDKIAKHFGISKYTLYSYLDVNTGGKSND